MPFRKSADSLILKARNQYWPPGAREGDDIEDFQRWRRELEDARRKFRDVRPLQAPQEFTLRVIAPSISSDSRTRRPLPACASATTSDVNVTLIRPLVGSHLGDDFTGRVWLARTLTNDSVVAKFYYPSYFIPDEQHNEWTNAFVLPHQCALAEEVAYGILQSAQGRWLPYYLGRTEVKLSNGEKADVALFEHIPGRTLLELQDEQWERDADGKDVPHEGTVDDPNSKFYKIHQQHAQWFVHLREIITEMHEAGIAHLDLVGRNILVPDDKPDYLVLIDFETARTIARAITISKRPF